MCGHTSVRAGGRAGGGLLVDGGDQEMTRVTKSSSDLGWGTAAFCLFLLPFFLLSLSLFLPLHAPLSLGREGMSWSRRSRSSRRRRRKRRRRVGVRRRRRKIVSLSSFLSRSPFSLSLSLSQETQPAPWPKEVQLIKKQRFITDRLYRANYNIPTTSAETSAPAGRTSTKAQQPRHCAPPPGSVFSLKSRRKRFSLSQRRAQQRGILRSADRTSSHPWAPSCHPFYCLPAALLICALRL